MPSRLYQRISHVVGVDFSGAAESGKTAWLAELTVANDQTQLNLDSLRPLGRLAGSDLRSDVCGYLADRVLDSEATLLGMDFPFGLPIELDLGDWQQQLERTQRFDGNAKEFGRHLVSISEQVAGSKHIRRLTDRETRTPFDCYHYRIIYQTFHGMRDVLLPISSEDETAVLPFQYEKVSSARRLVVEACPSSTLKRLGLPHQRYKQSGGKAPEPHHVETRKTILAGIRDFVCYSDHRRRIMLADSGGDALDAVLAAIGSWQALQAYPHASIAQHHRYPFEGIVYC